MGRRRSKTVQAALAVIRRGDRYLVCQRRREDFLGGYWEFPGGKREAGESWEACLRRELREELGVTVKAIKSYGNMRYRYAERSVLFKVFECAIARGRPRPLDAQALRWVPSGQLARHRFPPANRRLVASLAGRLRRPARRGINASR